MRKVYILNSKRTPIGKFLGSFYEMSTRDVCTQVVSNLFDNFSKKDVNEVIFGNVISAGLGQGIARAISIDSGIPVETPSYSLNMVCGSGMQAVINGFRSIQCGNNLELVGGLEFMSNIPYATNSYIRLGKKFGDFTMIDLMTHDGLIDSFSGVHMGITAENIARELNITREAQDSYSFLAQKRAIEAVDIGSFKNEIVPIKLKDWKNKEYIFDTDEFPNRNCTLEKLSSLKPSFLKDGTGTVTAGSSSGINDGAAFLLLGSDEYCKKNKIEEKIEIVATSSVGCDPQKMGLGPYYAITKLLDNCNVDFKDIDVFEINEAFAAQILGCFKLLGERYNVSTEYMINRTNLNGSGLGLGHPLGASGARIIVSLAHYMETHDVTYGIASLCIGGGQGTAVLLRKVK
ncbi:MAG: acetyl-CoA C-acyltransferase [Bacilli bacterium]|jgi:acetyl-CoA C-acetyltransferase|nr:acetyl-CoA C-acyltransferase [Bacilli bacterium]